MSVRQTVSPPATRRASRWLAGAGVAAAVVAVVVAVQAAAGGRGGGAGIGSTVSGSATPDVMVVQLFGTDTAAPDVSRTTVDDPAAGWPVAGCASAAVTDSGQTDFMSGTERGPEYSRDLAIGWYVDAAAAREAYDGVVARIADCAAEAGSQLTTDAAVVGEVGSMSVATAGAEAPDAAADAVAASLSAVALSGSVVVMAVDHAAFYGAPPAESAVGTTAVADRLLSEACRATGAGC